MPIPKRVARWNKAGLNRVTRHVAPWMPGLGLIVALTYGPDTDWVKNLQAAGGGELRTRGRTLRVGEPRVYHDPERTGIRPLERSVLRLLGAADFVHLKTAS